MVVIVTNHNDEDMGDMFVGVDETGKGHSAEVNQVCFLSNGASNLAEHLVSSSMFCGHHSSTSLMAPLSILHHVVH